MKLSYRGVHYEYTPPSLEVTEGEICGRYRGVEWRCRTVVDNGAPVRSLHNHPVSAPSQAEIPAIPAPHRTQFSILPEVRRLHYANLRHNIERRLQAAQSQGNQALVRALENEFEELLCRA
ncbi:DUF4278 domain-containing protein [Alkalinema sp. FACHB-956]|uniref:DUF4278 domain-containing protein n=1 Tax=Alkalinema sp. FACHB-956 TaxID=2692768 RepID=UPI0016863B6E|nr:DUF4278 domain-containing protein [Alkalinema sp. FACHB-956]MBD2326932.1 DUF4278 domain-containing protein [Alkalinema sp. FACHB-956]